MNLSAISPAVARRWILLVTIVFGFFWNLGSAPLFDEDEGFFAEGTREMVQNNDFVTTRVNGETRYDKPPLTNWLQYASVSVWGWNEWGVRFPSAIAGVIWMAIIFFYVRKKSGERIAFYAALMATCSLQITIIGKAAIADALLNMLLTGAMFCLYEGLLGRKWYWIASFYVLTALGFVAKGPVAVLIPGAVTLIYVLRWRKWQMLVPVFNPFGIALFLAIALPWYWLQYGRMGDEFIQGFFFNHNLNRFQTAFEGHYGGILYFVPVLLLGILPYTGAVLAVFSKISYLWYDRWFSFLLIWFAFVFIFFSLSGTKLHHYIVYGYSPLFILGGWYVNYRKQLSLTGPLIALLVLFMAFPFLVPHIIPHVNDAYATEVLKGADTIFDTTYIIQLSILIILMGVTAFYKSWPPEVRIWVTGMVMLVTVNLVVMPRVGSLLQGPVKEAAVFAKANQLDKIVVFDHYLPSFNFYSGLLTEERTPLAGDVILGKKLRLKDFPEAEILFEQYGIIIARLGASPADAGH